MPGGVRPSSFGWAIAFDGDTAVVGAPADELCCNLRGALYVFTRTAGTWSFSTRLSTAGPLTHTQLGASLSLHDGVLAAGAPSVSGSLSFAGRAALFVRRAPAQWEQLGAPLEPADGNPNDGFGDAVVLTADQILVGAPLDDFGSGTPDESLDFGSVRIWNRSTLAAADPDGDGLPTEWETRFGLDPASAAGAAGASGDPDADGLSNIVEFLEGTHPRGVARALLAEGATSDFFDTSLGLLNPGATDARIWCRFQRDVGDVVTRFLLIPPHTHATLDVKSVPGLQLASFSSDIEADAPIVVARTMRWGAGGYGAHSEMALESASPTWYFAEGATGEHHLFYLLQNPVSRPIQATVTYLLPDGRAPIERIYTLPPQSRTTIYVNQQPGLGTTAVSATIQSSEPIVAERAMYRNADGQTFAAGHASAGIAQPALDWFLAEGATGDFFDLFVLIANPSANVATIDVTYLLPDGASLSKTYTVAPRSRFTIYGNDERFPDAAGNRLLAATSVSTIVRSRGVPVVVERAMWWPHWAWSESHCAAGATQSGVEWATAGGRTGGSDGAETFVLIANTSTTAGEARVTLMFEDGASVQRVYPLKASSRTTVPISMDFPAARDRRFGVVVESLGASPAQLVVESASYFNSGGTLWAAGADLLAKRLR